MSVILVSVLGPPKYICGTHDVYNLNTWFRANSEYPGYICNRIKHLTGETFIAITHTGAYSGNVMITRDEGHNWTYSPFPGGQPVTLEVGAGYAWISDGQGIWRSRDGINWQLLSGSPSSCNSIAVFPDGKLMAHKADRLYKSPDLGSTWQQIYSPVRGSPFPWYDTTAVSGTPSFALAGKSSSYILASNGASIWRTTDFGNSWTKICSWNTWYIPRELHFVRGSNWVLKLRKLDPSSSQINVICTSFNDGYDWMERFNQDITHEHQIEYIKPLGLLLCGHTRYMTPQPWETWTARYVPALMASWDGGMTFREIVSDTFGQTFSIIAISGYVREPETYNMDVIIKKALTKAYSMGMTVKGSTSKQYTADLLAQKELSKTYNVDMLVKGTAAKTYMMHSAFMQEHQKTYDVKLDVAARIPITYTMDMRTNRRGYAHYNMSCLKFKTDKRNYDMTIIIVNDFTKPIKRDVIQNLPQGFEVTADVSYKITDETRISTQPMIDRY